MRNRTGTVMGVIALVFALLAIGMNVYTWHLRSSDPMSKFTARERAELSKITFCRPASDVPETGKPRWVSGELPFYGPTQIVDGPEDRLPVGSVRYTVPWMFDTDCGFLRTSYLGNHAGGTACLRVECLGDGKYRIGLCENGYYGDASSYANEPGWEWALLPDGGAK